MKENLFLVSPEDNGEGEVYVVTAENAKGAAFKVWGENDCWHDYSLFVADITGHEGLRSIGDFDIEFFEWSEYEEGA